MKTFLIAVCLLHLYIIPNQQAEASMVQKLRRRLIFDATPKDDAPPKVQRAGEGNEFLRMK
eukprot:CAMPEP_0198121270 /NCGR_PEP_ID=MMETSP1442-20131203/31623_1 /TAXON_ID= /ORGANISM="Craspedostauros australis, Strain CCMP3328" /LENGTH=60 /DNA_ID=CAMNT_0043780045 /DNA_START=101 /DNA_END=280 /DNA_ORIENTATION=+